MKICFYSFYYFFYSAGALLNFLGAVALGAPVKFQYVKVVISEYSLFFFFFFKITLHMEFVFFVKKD